MKKLLIVLPLLAVGAALAAEPAQPYSPAVTALRSECAQKYYAADKSTAAYDQKYEAGAKYASKYECTEDQYAAYLDTVEPERVMAAYPSGAGRPVAKPGSDAKGDPKADAKKYDDKKTDKDSH